MSGVVDDIWCEPRYAEDKSVYMDVMVSPQNFNYLKNKVENYGWKFSLITNDVQKLIEKSSTTKNLSKRVSGTYQ